MRVQGKRAGWYLRFNGKFAKLGGVGNPDVKVAAREAAHIYSLKDASEHAGRMREMLKLGMDPTGYLAARPPGQSHDEAASTGTSVAAGQRKEINGPEPGAAGGVGFGPHLIYDEPMKKLPRERWLYRGRSKSGHSSEFP